MKYNRLSRYQIKKIMKCFCEDLTATSAAKILAINRNTINAYYNAFRRKILEQMKKRTKNSNDLSIKNKEEQKKDEGNKNLPLTSNASNDIPDAPDSEEDEWVKTPTF